MKELPAEIITGITTMFNDSLKELFSSIHGVMPDDAIVLNVITCLFIARRECGIKDEQTKNEIVSAINKNAVWANDMSELR